MMSKPQTKVYTCGDLKLQLLRHLLELYSSTGSNILLPSSTKWSMWVLSFVAVRLSVVVEFIFLPERRSTSSLQPLPSVQRDDARRFIVKFLTHTSRQQVIGIATQTCCISPREPRTRIHILAILAALRRFNRRCGNDLRC